MRGPSRRRRGAENAPVAQSDRQGVVAPIVPRRTAAAAATTTTVGASESGKTIFWMPVIEGGVRKRAVRKMRMRVCAATKESYTLLSKKR